MRTWRQEAPTAGAEGFFSPFHPAIHVSADPGRVREPWWHAVRFDYTRLPVLERLLDITRLDYRLFTYRLARPRRAPVVRSWLPGYFFVEFDDRDAWRQLNLIPGVIEVLGTRLASGVVDDLVARLPQRPRPEGSDESIPRGTTVRVLAGMFQGHSAPVVWSERRRVKILMMMFERPTEIELRTKDVEIVA